jgi:outer membrane immunogenic protein
MKGVVGGAALVALVAAGPATADEMTWRSTAPVYTHTGFYNWTGFYIGLNGGGHWSNDSDPAIVTSSTFWNANNLAIVSAAVPLTFDKTGFAAGGQAGYNWYLYSFVLGVEADIMGLSGTAARSLTFTLPAPKQQDMFADSASDRWIATFRGRAGYAFDRVLFYITGGGAASNWSITHSYSDNFGAGTPLTTAQVTQTRYGWTAGGGIEYAVLNNWTVRAEYVYASFSAIGSTLAFQNTPGHGATFAHTDGFTESVARAAISYKLGG